MRNLVGMHGIGYEPLPMITSIVATLVGVYFLLNPVISVLTISLPIFVLFLLEGFNNIFQSRAMRQTVKYWNMVLASGAYITNSCSIMRFTTCRSMDVRFNRWY